MTEPGDGGTSADTSKQEAANGNKATPTSSGAGGVTAVANALRDVAVALASGFRDSPGLSALVLLFLIAACVTGLALYFVATNVGLLVVLLAFFVVTLVVAGLVYKRSNEQSARRFATVKDPESSNTLSYAELLTAEQKEIVGSMLQSMVAGLAQDLQIDPSKVRANIFGIGDDGRLHIVPDLTRNMTPGSELSVSMAIGSGSTGRCFFTRAPIIAVRQATGDGWGADILPASEMDKLHQDLSWIVSVPVVVGDADAMPVWVLNADGLVTVQKDRLDTIAPTLLYWAEALSLILRTNLP